MINWKKYTIDYSTNKESRIDRDSSFADHAEAMGYYQIINVGDNKKEFFDKFFFNYHSGRLLNYDKFLRKHIKKSEKVLSVASGRSANEIKLLEEGYDITCSDLEKLPSYENIKRLFPSYNFFILDILKQSTDKKYDCLVSLSLIYLFSNDQLDVFFKNLYESCDEKGCLILDSAGSPDNLLSYFIHDILLKYEAYIIRFFKNIFRKKKCGLFVQDFGYRRKNIEIIEIARRNGFEIIEQENFSFLAEFERSRILRKLMKVYFIKLFFGLIGKYVPYIRMFFFKKVLQA